MKLSLQCSKELAVTRHKITKTLVQDSADLVPSFTGYCSSVHLFSSDSVSFLHFIVFKLVGFYTQVEYHTSKGRIDLVLQADKLIYVLEFKLDGTAEEALQQIHDKHYALPFASDGRKLF